MSAQTTQSGSAQVDLSKGQRPKKPLTPWKSVNPNKPAKKQAPLQGIASLNGKWGYAFTAPFFLMFLVFGLAPIVYSTYMAFFNWDPLGEQVFIGVQNFQDLIVDDRFWLALANTMSIWSLSTFPQMIVSIGLAAILRSRALKAATFWRTILLVPNITSVIAVAIVFGQLFGRDFGMVNIVIGMFGGQHIDFLEQTLPGHIAIASMITWRWAGYNALIFLASMLAIPDDLYESASLDGATGWQQFIYVTLPQLRNTITFVLIVGTIGGLQVFAEPLTLGGTFDGGSSRQFSTLTLFLYEQAFVNNKWGYAAAIGILITVIVGIVSIINFFITRQLASEDKD
jgi:cellobiose transport system permease protein